MYIHVYSTKGFPLYKGYIFILYFIQSNSINNPMSDRQSSNPICQLQTCVIIDWDSHNITGISPVTIESKLGRNFRNKLAICYVFWLKKTTVNLAEGETASTYAVHCPITQAWCIYCRIAPSNYMHGACTVLFSVKIGLVITNHLGELC